MAKTPISVKLAKQGVLHAVLLTDSQKALTAEAACVGEDPELFFSEATRNVAKAKLVCMDCPIKEACASWAIQHEEFGVFGGLSSNERQLMRGGKPVIDPLEVDACKHELNFLTTAAASEVAEHFDVDVRTVVRWRRIIRKELEAA